MRIRYFLLALILVVLPSLADIPLPVKRPYLTLTDLQPEMCLKGE